MTSRAILIRDAVVDLLNAGQPTGVPEASTRWLFPGAPFEGPRIGVYLNQEPAQPAGGRPNTRSPVVDRERMVIVQLAVISESGDDLDDIVELIRSWTVKQLGDTNLGGLALAVEERGILEPPIRYQLDRYHLLAHCGWAVRYQTKRDDLGAAQ